MPRLAVVIVSWNRCEVTLDCLRRLAGLGLDAEITLVDNGSTDGTAQRVAVEFPDVRLIRSAENVGFGAGNNLALRDLEEGYVLLLNDDAGLKAEDLQRLVACMERHPEIGLIGPLITDGEGSDRVIAAGGRDVSRFARTNLGAADHPATALASLEPIPVDYVPGMVALVRSQVLARVGLLDEDYFFGGELADLCHRAAEAGLASAILPSARAWHVAAHAAPDRERLYPYYILRNRFLFLRKRRPRLRRLKTLWWALWGAASAGRWQLLGRRRRARAEALALVDALRGRWGGRNERLLR